MDPRLAGSNPAEGSGYIRAIKIRSTPSGVSRVAQSVYSLAKGCTTGRSRFDPRQRREDFSFGLCVQTGSGAHPPCCTMGTGDPLPRTKARPGRDADHSPPSSAEVVNENTPLLPSASMECSGTAILT
jgi:hypothetical protein